MHRPDNIGAVITLCLFYKNLHDHYHYGKPKMEDIMACFGRIQCSDWTITDADVKAGRYFHHYETEEKRDAPALTPELIRNMKFAKVLEKPENRIRHLTDDDIDRAVDQYGMNGKLYADYMSKIVKVVGTDNTYKKILGHEPVKSSTDRKRYLEAAEVAYKLTVFILGTVMKFSKTKINSMQRYVKNDMWALIDGRCKMTEFFDMLNRECRLEFGALDDWKRIVGDVHRKDGMPA